MYAYVGGDPVNYVDPLGREAATLTISGGIAASGGGAAIGTAAVWTGGIGLAGVAGYGLGTLIDRSLGVSDRIAHAIVGPLDYGRPGAWHADDGTPRNNQAQNKQFNDAVREIERRIGRKLTPDERRELHDAISGQNKGYKDIVDEGVGGFGDTEGGSESRCK